MRRNEKGGILLFQTRALIQFLFVSLGLLVSSWVHKDIILAGCVLAIWVAIGIAYLTIYLDR